MQKSSKPRSRRNSPQQKDNLNKSPMERSVKSVGKSQFFSQNQFFNDDVVSQNELDDIVKNLPIPESHTELISNKNQGFQRIMNKHQSILSDKGSKIQEQISFEEQQPPLDTHNQNQLEPLRSSSKLKRLQTIPLKQVQTAKKPIPSYVLIPSNRFKQVWDFIQMIILLYIALLSPFKVAFINDGDYPDWDTFDNVVSFLFIIDMVIQFISAYYNQDSILVTEPQLIAINYLKGWFVFDLVSSFPLYLFLDQNTQTQYTIARISKVPKIYRLFRMIRIARMIKVQDIKYVKIISLNTGVERIFFSFLLLIFSCHIVACLFYFISGIQEVDQWLVQQSNQSVYDQYVISLYWTIQTVLTVGYGDVHVTTWSSRIYATIWMILSVYVFSFTVGSLASFLDRVDQNNQKYLKRLNILRNIKKEFMIPNQIFNKVKKELKNDKNNSQNYNTLLEELPSNLRIELGVIMHQNLIQEISYFSNKPSNFIATIGPLLTPLKVGAHEYIFMTGDPAEEIYFVKTGKVAVVLPQYNNFKFILIKTGTYFGEIDILFYGEKRKYTCMTTKECEFYVLTRRHFRQIFLNNFRELGYELIKEAQTKKEQLKEYYKEALEFCERQDEEDSKPIRKTHPKFVTQKFAKSINSVSSKSMPESNFILTQIIFFIFQVLSDSTTKRNQMDNVIQEENEEDDQERETETMMKFIDREAFQKKITNLEKQIQIKDKIISNIQQELDELVQQIQKQNKQDSQLSIIPPFLFEDDDRTPLNSFKRTDTPKFSSIIKKQDFSIVQKKIQKQTEQKFKETFFKKISQKLKQ